ncbi:MFS transporter [Natronobacterium texcoconense]|uniref:Predicted arabinose efflux permease, MFS family n=1 Tax=Natronobacterium texcoconense TaxID=1095778 RepID=A0A1H1ICY0_NATTX|nr:MFS transporter [Natronobacterium texcoconense]SDR35542.1 Predicted arabinose efflux permease, MFS family [Natronobacterium texcoconense]
MDDSDREIVLFTSAAHGLVHTYELSIPILMTVWLVEFSTTEAMLGLIVTVGYGLFGVGALPGGVLVDQYGSKPLILACLAGMAGSFVLVGLSGSILFLSIAIALWGVTASVYHPAGLALLSTRVERTGIALGYHGIGGNLGIALGPLATAILLLWFDWRIVSILLAIPAVVVLVLGLFVEVAPREAESAATTDGGPEREESNDTKGQVSLDSFVDDTRKLLTLTFGLVLLVVMMSGLYYRAFLTFLPDLLSDFLAGLVDIELVDPDSPYAEEFDLARYFYVAILVFGVFGQYLGGYLADRIPVERALVYVLVTLTILAVLFVPATATTPAFVVVSLLLGVALFTIQPLQQATVAKHTSPGTRGISFGYTFLVIFGIGALGAGLAGWVLTVAGARELFLVLGTIAVIGATIAFVLRRVDRSAE